MSLRSRLFRRAEQVPHQVREYWATKRAAAARARRRQPGITYAGEGMGALEPRMLLTGVSFLAVQLFDAGSRPFAVTVGDFNGDRKVDLVTANKGTNSVSVLLGNGDGTFRAKQSFGAGNSPIFVAVGDFNGDGKSDLATANDGDDSVSVLLGNGDGTFQAKHDFGAGSSPSSVAVGDFDRDGQSDLVTANYYGGVSVLLGNGDGTFRPAQDFGAGSCPEYVAVGDFDDDGKSDLVTANNGGWSPSTGYVSTVSVLLGNGDGTFQAHQEFGAGICPWSVSVGDFNRDGQSDLVTANVSDNGVGVLLGNGDGTFEAGDALGTGDSPESVTVGDFNDDGNVDIAAANYSADNLSVLLGNGDGTFQESRNFGVGSGPKSVTLADFNGDGKSDLVMANNGGSSVSVLLNTTGDIAPSAVDLAWEDLGTPMAYLYTTGGILPVTRTYDVSGAADMPGFAIQYRLSADRIWGNADDIVLADDEAIATAGGKALGAHARTVMLSAGRIAAGRYYILGRIDNGETVAESNEDNNTIVGSQISVLPGAWDPVGSLPLFDAYNAFKDVTVNGGLAYIASDDGLSVVDVADPANPVLVGRLASIRPSLVQVAGGKAYALADGKLWIVDVSNASHPVALGSCAVKGASDIHVAGAQAYVVGGDGSNDCMQVVNVANPSKPKVVGTVAEDWFALGVQVVGQLAYLADGMGLRVVDVSKAASPKFVGFSVSRGTARDVQVANGFAYVADGQSGLTVYDLSNARSPRRVGALGFDGADQIRVIGKTAYVFGHYSQDQRTFKVIDVSNPAAPKVLRNDSRDVADVEIVGSRAYLVTPAGLQIIQLSASVPQISVALTAPARTVQYRQAAAINIGSAKVNATGPTKVFRVTNTGGGNLVLGQLTVPAGYQVVDGLAAWLAAGQSDVFTIKLVTKKAGKYAGSISFTTNVAGKAKFTFPIAGAVTAGKT